MFVGLAGSLSRTLFIVLSCIAWIFLNILAQAAVAINSLTFSINDGRDYNDTYIMPGTANVSNLTCYFNDFNGGPCGGDVASQALAHAYGDLAVNSNCERYTEVSAVLKSEFDYGYYCKRARHQQEFTYTASSGACLEYSMVGEPPAPVNGNLIFVYKNKTYSGNITIPVHSGAIDGTTWIYRDTKPPQQADEYACGPRYIKVWAHKSRGHGENSTLYECPITVNHVSNKSSDEHDAPNDVACLNAASIALQGRPSGLVN